VVDPNKYLSNVYITTNAATSTTNAATSNVWWGPKPKEKGVKMATKVGPVTAKYDQWYAAQQLRTILHAALENGVPIGKSSKLTASKKSKLLSYHQLNQIRIDEVESLCAQLDELVRARKVKGPLELTQKIRVQVRHIAINDNNQKYHIEDTPVPSSAPDDWQTKMKLLYELAQCLPTQPNLPSSRAEDTVQAICALLRNHQVPGTDDLSIAAKEVLGNGSNQNTEEPAEVGVDHDDDGQPF